MTLTVKKPAEATPESDGPSSLSIFHPGVSDLFESENFQTEQEIVDRFLTLEKMVAKLKENPAFKALTEAEAKVKELMEQWDEAGGVSPDEEIILKGTRGHVTYSARKNVRSIPNMGALLLVMGEESFLANASVALGKIDKYLTPEEQAEVLVTEQTGPRVKTVVHTMEDI